MKIKGYYLHFGSEVFHSGVMKKIQAQTKFFASFSSIEYLPVELKKRTLVVKIQSRLPFFGMGYDYEDLLKKINDPDYVYIRPTYVDNEYINFLKKLKNKYPKIKIIVELYTYPYDKDFFHSFDTIPLYIKDVINRKKSKKCIDRFATLTNDEFIFHVKTLRIENGVDLDLIPCNYEKSIEPGVIRLISVAVMQGYHGFERLIEGLNNYYLNDGNRNIIYTVVGDSNDGTLDYLKNLSTKYNLNEHIIFVGKKTGNDLHNLVNKSDIGVCSLGLYKLGINSASPLKSREYLAYGMPMISGCNISLFEKYNFRYCLYFANDSSPIDVDKIIAFYDEIYLNNNNSNFKLTKEIRKFAEEHIGMEVAMKEVKNYLLGE